MPAGAGAEPGPPVKITGPRPLTTQAWYATPAATPATTGSRSVTLFSNATGAPVLNSAWAAGNRLRAVTAAEGVLTLEAAA